MAKLAHTSESVIHVGNIVLNLEKRLRAVLLWLHLGLLACERCALTFLAAFFQPLRAWEVNPEIIISAYELA